MTTFINDEGKEIQISEDILITRQVASFKNFAIKGDYSVSFTVPNTSSNREALGYYGHNQINSPVFSDNYFNLVRNGNIIMRGLIVIEQDTGDDLSLYFISGNANWFKEFEFNCREIRSKNYWSRWRGGSSNNSVDNSLNKTDGIVYPIIDWVCNGKKADRYFNDFVFSGSSGDVFLVYEYFPCLYVHTLLEEIARHSGIKIEGNIFNDKLFKSIIFTPDSPDIYDPETGTLLKMDSIDSIENLVKVEAIAPNMKAIEILRWVCVTFGIVPLYDEASKTLTLDVLDKRVLTGEDWSEYVQGYTIKYDQVQNNYVRVSEAPEDKFEAYNSTKEVKFGEVNIQTKKNDGQSNEWYESPFPPCYDSVSPTIDLAVSYIPMYNLEDEGEYPYTSVEFVQYVGTDEYRKFVGIGFPFDSNTLSPIYLRIEDDNDYYDGYFHAWTYLANYNSNNQVTVYGKNKLVSPVTSTGKIYTQKVSKGNPGTRVLIYIPSLSVDDMTFAPNIKLGSPVSSTGVSLTNVPTAYYYKPWYSQYPNYNKYKQGLSYGYITDYNDYSIAESYFKYIRGMVSGPTIQTTMLIPENVFSSFEFDFIYLNTGRLNGYFFVDSITNYKDSVTPVEVNLLEVSQDHDLVKDQTKNYVLVAETGSYEITGISTSFTYTPLTHTIELSRDSQYVGSFSCEFAGDQETKTLTRTNNSTTSSTLLFSSSVTATVTRVGNAADAVSVEWFKNGVSQDVQNITAGNPVNVNYTFTSLTGNETLRVEVIEG